MRNNKKIAFTLIELVIVITLFFILVSASYIPYSYYINKAKVRNTIKEISQSLYEARNMAINWTSSGSNISVWIYMDAENNSNKLQFFSYPHYYTWAQIVNNLWTDIKLIKTYDLQPGINITNINWENNWLFFFESISWSWAYYYFDSNGTRNNIVNKEIKINLSYKWAAIWSPLAWELIYYTNTNIVDY